MPNADVDDRYIDSVQANVTIFGYMYYYNEFDFKINAIIEYLCYGVLGIGLLGAVFGIFAKRSTGLQAVITCQICLLSMIWLNTILLDPFKQA